MKNNIKLILFILCMAFCGNLAAQPSNDVQIRKWKIGDQEREAMVYIPASAKSMPTPVIFVFHGHGGNMKNIFNALDFDKLWPEAIVIAPQGLQTPGKLVDPDGKFSGWQQSPGDMDDRDIHFFDEMLKTLQDEYKVDRKRIYATGHSNGGSFSYLLWAMRGDVFAAVAPSAAVAFRFNNMLTPKPVIHIMGSADPLVKPAWQEMQIARLLKLNQCDADGKPYANSATIYSSSNRYPVVVYKHSGGHVYPKEAYPIVIKFFKSSVKTF